MLRITIPSVELWDENKEEFINTKEKTLSLEHSLVSLSKWESKWCKPFFGKTEKTLEETIDYIRCMTLTQNVDPSVYQFLTNSNVEEINRYISAPMTATWFSDNTVRHSREQVTAELIYYWMIVNNIPFECQKWHLNRLLTLIRVCNIKNQPPKKRSRKEIMRRNSALNAARRQRLHTKG